MDLGPSMSCSTLWALHQAARKGHIRIFGPADDIASNPTTISSPLSIQRRRESGHHHQTEQHQRSCAHQPPLCLSSESQTGCRMLMSKLLCCDPERLLLTGRFGRDRPSHFLCPLLCAQRLRSCRRQIILLWALVSKQCARLHALNTYTLNLAAESNNVILSRLTDVQQRSSPPLQASAA